MIISVNRSRNLAEVTGDGSEPQPVFESRQRNTATAFSPDTRQLAFLSDRSGTWEVWIADREGTHFVSPRQLTQGLGWYPSSVVWSPDGQTLAVGISNTNDIEMVDVHSGAINHLRLPGLGNSATWSPAWSNDGRWIYMAAWGDRHGIFRASATPVPAVEQVVNGSAREVRIGSCALLHAELWARDLSGLPDRRSPAGGGAAAARCAAVAGVVHPGWVPLLLRCA